MMGCSCPVCTSDLAAIVPCMRAKPVLSVAVEDPDGVIHGGGPIVASADAYRHRPQDLAPLRVKLCSVGGAPAIAEDLDEFAASYAVGGKVMEMCDRVRVAHRLVPGAVARWVVGIDGEDYEVAVRVASKPGEERGN